MTDKDRRGARGQGRNRTTDSCATFDCQNWDLRLSVVGYNFLKGMCGDPPGRAGLGASSGKLPRFALGRQIITGSLLIATESKFRAWTTTPPKTCVKSGCRI